MTMQEKASKRNLLAIVGVSGSGKSTLERNLVERFPDLFNKWQQVSTRKMRPGERYGDPYIFVQDATFEDLKEKLVGRLGVVPNSIFPAKYGSIADYVDGKISTVILAEEAIIDLKEEIKKGNVQIDNLFIFGLDVEYGDLDAADLREGRGADFLDKERTVLRHANMTYRNTNGKYLDPKIVLSILEAQGFF